MSNLSNSVLQNQIYPDQQDLFVIQWKGLNSSCKVSGPFLTEYHVFVYHSYFINCHLCLLLFDVNKIDKGNQLTPGPVHSILCVSYTANKFVSVDHSEFMNSIFRHCLLLLIGPTSINVERDEIRLTGTN